MIDSRRPYNLLFPFFPEKKIKNGANGQCHQLFVAPWTDRMPIYANDKASGAIEGETIIRAQRNTDQQPQKKETEAARVSRAS